MRTDVISIRDVPPSWIYEFYLGITLTGNTTKAHSPLGTMEKRMSLSIHRHDDSGVWTWRDFRAAKQGNASWLIYEMALEGKITLNDVTPDNVCRMIVRDYREYIDSGGSHREPEVTERWRFSGYGLREWSTADRDFWTPFKLGSKELEQNKVAPLDWYAYEKEDGSQEFKTEGINVYGYFTQSGLLYKIYQPYNERKYRKIRSHLEGMDCVNPKNKHLLIMSGKKDMMCFQLLGLPFNVLCADSETCMLPADQIKNLLLHYDTVSSMLDDDDTGHTTMDRYREMGVKKIDMGMENDFALCVRDHDLEVVRTQFINQFKVRT